jgi:two-component system, response regulator
VTAPDRPILVVEDNDDDLELALRALREHDTRDEVALARDGVEASEFLFGTEDAPATRPLPSVVFLDLKLPRVSGFEVLRRIRANARTKLLPVVVLTSSREEEDIVSSYALGANSYVRKPVDYATFRSAVRSLRDYWLALNEVPPAEPHR